jgi:hypothetical protein
MFNLIVSGGGWEGLQQLTAKATDRLETLAAGR